MISASELVARLQALIAEHGDLPVWLDGDHDWITSVVLNEGDPDEDQTYGLNARCFMVSEYGESLAQRTP